MFNFWRNRTLELQLKVESDLRSQIMDLKSQLQAKQDEIALLNGKLDRFELMLMPRLRTGQRIEQPTSAAAPEPPAPTPIKTSWQALLEKHMKEIDDGVSS